MKNRNKPNRPYEKVKVDDFKTAYYKPTGQSYRAFRQSRLDEMFYKLCPSILKLSSSFIDRSKYFDTDYFGAIYEGRMKNLLDKETFPTDLDTLSKQVMSVRE